MRDFRSRTSYQHTNMKFILIFCISIYAVGLIFHLLTKKYINPYKLYLIFAPKGEGKSTLLQKLAHHYYDLGYHIYCKKGDCDLPFVTPIDVNLIPYLAEAYYDESVRQRISKIKGYTGPLCIEPNSVILHDEINIDWDNRDFKSFPKPVQHYFRLQRQYKHIYIGFSQTYDCDKKIRDLADYLIIIRKYFRVYITGKAYRKKPIVVSPSDENGRETAAFTDDYVKQSWFWWYRSSPFRAWLPHWVKVNKSYRDQQDNAKLKLN